ncbi:hypothetical protein M9458_046146, partial [Cirrhinus mrigala]
VRQKPTTKGTVMLGESKALRPPRAAHKRVTNHLLGPSRPPHLQDPYRPSQILTPAKQ